MFSLSVNPSRKYTVEVSLLYNKIILIIEPKSGFLPAFFPPVNNIPGHVFPAGKMPDSGQNIYSLPGYCLRVKLTKGISHVRPDG
jgi:hypothetical protein